MRRGNGTKERRVTWERERVERRRREERRERRDERGERSRTEWGAERGPERGARAEQRTIGAMARCDWHDPRL